jgi:hypothetical protein
MVLENELIDGDDVVVVESMDTTALDVTEADVVAADREMDEDTTVDKAGPTSPSISEALCGFTQLAVAAIAAPLAGAKGKAKHCVPDPQLTIEKVPLAVQCPICPAMQTALASSIFGLQGVSSVSDA